MKKFPPLLINEPNVPEQQVMVLLVLFTVESVELPPVVPSLIGRPWALEVSLGNVVPGGGGGGGGVTGGVFDPPPPQEMMDARKIAANTDLNMVFVTRTHFAQTTCSRIRPAL